MPKDLGEIKSIKADCEECGAEIVIVTLYKPGFRDLSPLCPYCHFPMTRDIDPDVAVENLTKALDAVQAANKREVAA
ncbi:hypothetical protein KP003_16810 [Geomonas nitrogeniifigens]|uniref:hypothetical protein n=1 Tax=Geomonas diazotrophica TaxID=2843197 RepID=UPI001C2C50AA|nr:hypothetical protein [Geomonas nitrogeniifigens]QXE86003.1 hypothetical protein KP003_16810 [Geomonas nitrogeniifigens]